MCLYFPSVLSPSLFPIHLLSSSDSICLVHLEARVKAQKEKKAMEQQKHQEEAPNNKAKDLTPTEVVVAECPPQLGHSTDNTPIFIPITFDEPIPPAQSSSTQLTSQTFPLPLPPSGCITCTSGQCYVPPLPPPSVYGVQSPRYPSQAADCLMGGVLATTSSHGRPGSRSNVGSHSNIPKIRSEKGQDHKRQFKESGRGGKESICDLSGLSTSQRVAAFLSSANVSGKLLTDGFVNKPPLKKKAYQPTAGFKEHHGHVGDKMAARQIIDEKTPAPNESYFPVPELPPLQVRSDSSLILF